MVEYIFFVPDNLAEYLFADVLLDNDFDIVHLKKTFLGRILLGNRSPAAKFLRKFKILDYFKNSFSCYSFGKYKKLDSDKKYVFVFVAGAASVLPAVMLKRISEKQNVVLALLLMDSFHASSPTAIKLRDICFKSFWKKVYTFDKNDSKEFGFKNIGLSYYSTSKFPVQKNETDNQSNVFFVGGLKEGRENLILSLFTECEKHGIKADFILSCMNKQQWKNRKFAKKIMYIKKWVSYSEVLKKVSGTNCIIEILQKNQQTQSVRYFEAVVFNKKLLTNNPNVFSLPFYDSRYMKYFENISDIDFEWIKKQEKINYNYNNEFSAIHLSKMIKDDFERLTGGGSEYRIVYKPFAVNKMRRAA